MGAGRGYIQNNEYLITAMFQSRVCMIRESIVKHIFLVFMVKTKQLRHQKSIPVVLGILVLKSKPFLSGMIQYLVPFKLLT